MTDLTTYGVEVEDPDSESESADQLSQNSRRRGYPNGRCPAIANSHRGRCRAPSSRMNAAEPFCGTHGRAHNPWTIHDPAEKLILITGGIDALSLDEVQPHEVDFDLGSVREAVAAVGGEWER